LAKAVDHPEIPVGGAGVELEHRPGQVAELVLERTEHPVDEAWRTRGGASRRHWSEGATTLSGSTTPWGAD
jgi:hypothetical protein